MTNPSLGHSGYAHILQSMRNVFKNYYSLISNSIREKRLNSEKRLTPIPRGSILLLIAPSDLNTHDKEGYRISDKLLLLEKEFITNGQSVWYVFKPNSKERLVTKSHARSFYSQFLRIQLKQFYKAANPFSVLWDFSNTEEEFWNELFTELKPSAVITFDISIEIIAATSKRNVTLVEFQHGVNPPNYYENLEKEIFSRDLQSSDRRILVSWDPTYAGRLSKVGFQDFILGHPYLCTSESMSLYSSYTLESFYIERTKALSDLTRTRNSLKMLVPLTYKLKHSADKFGQISREELDFLKELSCNRPEVVLNFRIHPILRPFRSRISKWLQHEFSNGNYLLSSSESIIRDLLESDLIFSAESTLIFEAALLGIVSISVREFQTDYYPKWVVSKYMSKVTANSGVDLPSIVSNITKREFQFPKYSELIKLVIE